MTIVQRDENLPEWNSGRVIGPEDGWGLVSLH